MIARLVHRGVVSHEDLVAEGVSPDAIHRRVRARRLIPKWRGVYLVGHGDPPPLGLEYAALKFAGPNAVLSDRTAAVAYRLLSTQVDPTIHITLTEKRGSPRGLRLHTRTLRDEERRTIHGDIRITTPERTILDIAPTLDDEQLENVVADAIRRKLMTVRELERQLELRKGHRGTKRLRRVLDLGPQWTASRAERVFLALVRAAGFPTPEANLRMGRQMPDFIWRDERVIVEIDGWGSHGDRIAFERDRARSTERTAHGWRPLQFTWRRLRDNPHWVVSQIAGARAQAASTRPRVVRPISG